MNIGPIEIVWHGFGIPWRKPEREAMRLAREGRRIEAIKHLRATRGLGLKDAKDVVDRLVPFATEKAK